MTSFRFFPTLLAAVTACLVVMAEACDAFAIATREHRMISSRFQLQPHATAYHHHPSRRLFTDQDQAKSCARTWRQQRHTSRHDTMLHYDGKNNNDDSTSNEKKTVIEDGSPLGVAIVVIGGCLVIFGDLDIPFWFVAVTASVAAGISRVIKYFLQNKENY